MHILAEQNFQYDFLFLGLLPYWSDVFNIAVLVSFDNSRTCLCCILSYALQVSQDYINFGKTISSQKFQIIYP